LARKKEKENVDISTYKKLIPYSSSSAKNSPNQVLTPFLVVEKDFAVNTHILMDSHLYYFYGLSVWTLNFNSNSLDWKPAPSMNVSRSGARHFTLDGKLYMLGGLEGQSVPPTHGWMEVFDPIVQKWEPLPNPPSTTMCSATMICTVLKSKSQKEILVIDDFGKFYIYNLRTQCWKTLQVKPRQSRPLSQYKYKRPATVGNTLYWASLDRPHYRYGMCIVQAYNVDTDVWFEGFFNTNQLFKKPEFLFNDEYLFPLIHVADQKFCLLLESCIMHKNRGHPPEFDTRYVNFLVLDIHVPDDDDDEYDDDDDDYEPVYHKLSVSIVSIQKHILGEDHRCFGLWDAVLL
jgi:hypothetical protein